MRLTDASPFGDAKKAYIFYADRILLDETSTLDVHVDNALGNRILSQIATLAPQKLSRYVLNSHLRDFDLDIVLTLLKEMEERLQDIEQFRKHDRLSDIDAVPETKSQKNDEAILSVSRSIRKAMHPQNIFLKIVLHLWKGEEGDAARDLRKLQPEMLEELCLEMPHFLFSEKIFPGGGKLGKKQGEEALEGGDERKEMEEGSSSTHRNLSHLMLVESPWILFEVVNELRKRGMYPAQKLADLLSVERLPLRFADSFGKDVLQCYAILSECMYEKLLATESATKDTVIRLASLYLSHLRYDGGKYPPMTLYNPDDDAVEKGIPAIFVASHMHTEDRVEMHQRRFIRSRPYWLDGPSFRELFHAHNAVGPAQPAAASPFSMTSKAFDAENFYVLKMQGLLTDPAAMRLLRQGDKQIDAHEYILAFAQEKRLEAFQLLALPVTGRLAEALPRLLQVCAPALLEYCQYYASTAEEWQRVVATVLQYLCQCDQDDSVDAGRDKVAAALEELLTHLASTWDPATFLSLLPENGSLLYFLPFLELSIHENGAREITKGLMEQAWVRMKEESGQQY